MTLRIDDLFWARYLAGELSGWERWRLRRALRASAALRAEHEALLAERAQFDAAFQRATEVDALHARLARSQIVFPQRRRGWTWALAAPGAALAVAVLVLWLQPPESSPTFVAKGPDSFLLFVNRLGQVAPLGEACAPGEAIRAQYRTDRPFLLIVGQDASGTVQALFPLGGEQSIRLDRADGLTPGSWVLDDVPGRERFVAVFSAEPLLVRDVAAALAQCGAEPLVLPNARVQEQWCQKDGP